MKATDWVQAGVGLMTLGLAVITWLMARATKDMADATREMARTAHDELELLRRQTEAAELATEHSVHRLQSQLKPRLTVHRSTASEPTAYLVDGNQFGLTLMNSGPIGATISEVQAWESADRVVLEPGGEPHMEPNDSLPFSSRIPAELVSQIRNESKAIPIRVSFLVSYNIPYVMTAVLEPADGGMKWLVSVRESTDPV